MPVNLDDALPAGSTGLTEATLDLTYDPRVLTVSAADVHLGSLPSLGTGWTVSSVVNQAAGQLVIQLYSLTPLTVSASGSLVIVDFHMGGEWRVAGGGNAFTSPLATQHSPLISLVDWANPTGQVWFRTSLSDTNGALTLGNSTGQAGVSGAARGASGETSMAAPVAISNNPGMVGNSEPDAQVKDIIESLAGASGSEIDVVRFGAEFSGVLHRRDAYATQEAGPSGVPSDPATAAVFQFGGAPFLNVLPLVTPTQLLTAEVFSDLARQSWASGDQDFMDVDVAVDGEPSGQALVEVFAQLGLE